MQSSYQAPFVWRSQADVPSSQGPYRVNNAISLKQQCRRMLSFLDSPQLGSSTPTSWPACHCPSRRSPAAMNAHILECYDGVAAASMLTAYALVLDSKSLPSLASFTPLQIIDVHLERRRLSQDLKEHGT